MKVTTLQALDLNLHQLQHQARTVKSDAQRAYYARMATFVQDEIVAECMRLHARGGAIPATLSSVPC